MMSNNNSSHLKMMENIEDRLYRYRAKRLRFLINGDKFFTGINYALNTEKTRSYDSLLNELTKSLMDHIKLCKGVRYIFTLDGRLINNLTDFQDGCTYICSSTETFILIDYRINNGMLNWLVRNSASISSSNNVVIRSKRNTSANQQSQANSATKLLLPSQSPSKTTSHNNSSSTSSSNFNNNDSQLSTKPPISATSNNNNGIPKQSNHTKTRSPQPKRNSANNRNSNNHSGNRISHNYKSNTPNQEQQNNKTVIRTKNGNSHNTTPINNSNNRQKASHSPPANQTIILKTQKDNEESSNFDCDVKKKYDIGRPIGDGHFSVVYCCMNKTTQELCALKLIDKQKCRGRDDMIYNEVKILKQLKHPNIVKLIEEFDYSKQLYLILELVQDGDLFDAISNVTKFDEVNVATMIYNLSSALTYLHKQGIVHRDIKPENLLISVQEDGSQSVKLADFGLAVEVGNDPLYSVCGTAFYVSPEMLNETGYDFKVDVWSTGVICFILLCGYPPFTSENESNQDELFDAILAGDFQFAPPYWSNISQHAKNLIKCMLTVNPNQRYTAEQVFQHPWTMGCSNNFDGINPMNLSRKIAQQSQ